MGEAPVLAVRLDALLLGRIIQGAGRIPAAGRRRPPGTDRREGRPARERRRRARCRRASSAGTERLRHLRHAMPGSHQQPPPAGATTSARPPPSARRNSAHAPRPRADAPPVAIERAARLAGAGGGSPTRDVAPAAPRPRPCRAAHRPIHGRLADKVTPPRRGPSLRGQGPLRPASVSGCMTTS